MALINGNILRFCVKSYRKIMNNSLSFVQDGDYSFHKKHKGKSFVFLNKGEYVVSFNSEILDVFIENEKYIT